MLVNPAIPTNCTGTRIVACLLVTISAVCFLWAYSAVAHREPLVFPGKQPTTSSIDRADAASASAVSPQTPAVAAVEIPAAKGPANSEHERKIKHRKATKAPRKSDARRVLAGGVRSRSNAAAYAQAPSSEHFAPF